MRHHDGMQATGTGQVGAHRHTSIAGFLAQLADSSALGQRTAAPTGLVAPVIGDC